MSLATHSPAPGAEGKQSTGKPITNGAGRGGQSPARNGWPAFVGLLQRGVQKNLHWGAGSRGFPGRGRPEGRGAGKWPSVEEVQGGSSVSHAGKTRQAVLA